MNVLPLILCGGSGSRLWPLSRANWPKPFHALFGTNTLFESTIRRASQIQGAQRLAVVCHEQQRFTAAQQAQASTALPFDLVLEPVGRDTAPAIAVIAQRNLAEDPVLIVLPADHYLPDTAALLESIAKAVALAQQGYLVTVGVKPHSPEMAYDYIQAGAAIKPLQAASTVVGLARPKDAATAAQWAGDDRYSWNSGILAVRASVYLRELTRYSPHIQAACQQALECGTASSDFFRLEATHFAACPSISVENGLIQHSDCVVTVRYDGAWQGLANWATVAKAAQVLSQNGEMLAQALEQPLAQSVLEIEATNNLVRAHKPVVLLGVSGVSVIDTADALLVVAHSHAQSLPTALTQLKSTKPHLLESHRKVHRPWGWYEVIDGSPGFQVKQIEVNPGASLSLQSHAHRAEHWVVVEGLATITVDDSVMDYGSNSHVYIPLHAKHRLQNQTAKPVRLIEVQCGSYLGEDDIVRYEDVYHRVAQADL